MLDLTQLYWEITHDDTFDRECPTQVEHKGSRLEDGFTWLWITTLREGFVYRDEQENDVLRSFSRFTLTWAKDETSECEGLFCFWDFDTEGPAWAQLKKQYDLSNCGTSETFKAAIQLYVGQQLAVYRQSGEKGLIKETRALLKKLQP